MIKIITICVLFAAVICKFPPGFKFGAATAAFQIEGAWLQDGKSPSIWDNVAHLPNYTADGRYADISADSYNRYLEDIELLKNAGIKHYRMSISWPRIVPKGSAGSPINDKAVKRYREMFQAMLDAGITPYVTLYHWDLPAVLTIDKYGIVDRYFVQDFTYYAKACFEQFGDLVKYWFTFNEPWCVSTVVNDFKKRDEGTKPYLIAHNTLLAHAATVKMYREQFKSKQGGQIGIVLNPDMYYPKNPNNPSDVEAAKRATDFTLGWFADPVFYGDYPEVMKKRVGDRLPKFTEAEKALLKGSTDFFGLNHYMGFLTEDDPVKKNPSYWNDRGIITSSKPEWKKTDMGWPVVPEGIHDMIVEIHRRYLKDAGNMPIMITENGMANREPTEKESKNDTPRIEYMSEYLKNIEKAIDVEKINVTGYFTWTLIDNFEWREGFSKRFGIVRVEFNDIPVRIPKASYYWYAEFIKKNTETVVVAETH